jgi:two-component system chemotaxis response regulator CheB
VITAASQIRILLVDDSAVVRKAMSEGLAAEGDMRVVAVANNPFDAREALQRGNFDVMVLDVEMPRMDGLTFMRRLAAHGAPPVVMCTSLARRSAAFVSAARQAGVHAVIRKPHNGYPILTMMRDLAEAIRSAYRASLPAREDVPQTNNLLVVGASTGGMQAFERFLKTLPEDAPPLVVAQHLPHGFCTRYAGRLNLRVPQHVRVATDGERLQHGDVVIAPSTHHVKVRRDGLGVATALDGGPPVNHHRPSVDVLFESAVQTRPRDTFAVLLTGMGRDGAEGMLHLKQAGAQTVVQDEATSTVFGMPKAALDIGAATDALPVDRIGAHVLARLRG